MAFRPTAQQTALFDTIEHTDENIALVARAGTGKTTTALEAIPALLKRDPRAEILFVAFGKAISVEINDKLKARGYDWRKVQASTTHGMGWSLVKFNFKLQNEAIDGAKVRNLIFAKVEELEAQAAAALAAGNREGSDLILLAAKRLKGFWTQICKLVSYAKIQAFGYPAEGFAAISDPVAWAELAEQYDVDGLELERDRDTVIDWAQYFYQASLDKVDVVDFDDMILWPLLKNLRVNFKKDVIIIDEAQDTSKARQVLIEKHLKPGGRVLIVGDDRQAIMGFAGADPDAMDNLIANFGAVRLPLNVTFRCPKSVVALARTIVEDYEAHEHNKEGEVVYAEQLPADLGVGDAILCRNVAPLIDIAYQLIRSGRPAKVEGRAIGEGLIALARRWSIDTIDELLHRLDGYEDREVAKAQAKGNDQKVEQIQDKVGTLREICRATLARGKTTVAAVVEFIETLFADGAKGVITLASYHRSKGREWKRVILFNHKKLSPSKFAKREDARRQEMNLSYVAKTRSMETLMFVDPPKEERGRRPE